MNVKQLRTMLAAAPDDEAEIYIRYYSIEEQEWQVEKADAVVFGSDGVVFSWWMEAMPREQK